MTQYLTKAEVAERLRVSEHTVARYIRRGLLTAVKTTDTPQGQVRITTDSFEAYVARQTVTPGRA
ncbi:helix-turn-helix domain-containing protein [Actinomadura luteofluorescens]|uniref:helix-turn-helix domain-containing protein n=1 Tax=Actinomadura luteofluorescens TaxID=46163 RepID=UPI003D8C9282